MCHFAHIGVGNVVIGYDMAFCRHQIARTVAGKEVDLAVLFEEGKDLPILRGNTHIALIVDFREHLWADQLRGGLRRQRYAYPQAIY